MVSKQNETVITRELFTVPPVTALRETIKHLYRLSEKAVNNPDFCDFVKAKFSANTRIESFRLIHRYLNTYIKYIPDDFDETLTAPYLLAKTGGDCDDFSLFAYTALKILNIPAGLLILGTLNGFEHICAVAWSNSGQMYVIDGTNSQFDNIPTKYTRFRYV